MCLLTAQTAACLIGTVFMDTWVSVIAGVEGTAKKQNKPLPSRSSCFAVCVCVCVRVSGEAGYRIRNMTGVDQCQEEKQNRVRGIE